MKILSGAIKRRGIGLMWLYGRFCRAVEVEKLSNNTGQYARDATFKCLFNTKWI